MAQRRRRRGGLHHKKTFRWKIFRVYTSDFRYTSTSVKLGRPNFGMTYNTKTEAWRFDGPGGFYYIFQRDSTGAAILAFVIGGGGTLLGGIILLVVAYLVLTAVFT